ncbi:MAG: hypothetical protein AAGH90_02425 [Pseudomonadota bacterium]
MKAFIIHLSLSASVLLQGYALADGNDLSAPKDYKSEAECVGDKSSFLALDYMSFDQDPKIGYRSVLMQPGCELVAADLIRDYHKALRDKGDPVLLTVPEGSFPISENGELSILYWHEGQIRAFEGQFTQAQSLFSASLKPTEQSNRGWNEYVRGSIAFLENDLDELKRQRDLMAGSKNPSQLNLGVLDGLIACFGRPYAEAYGSTDCNRR